MDCDSDCCNDSNLAQFNENSLTISQESIKHVNTEKEENLSNNPNAKEFDKLCTTLCSRETVKPISEGNYDNLSVHSYFDSFDEVSATSSSPGTEIYYQLKYLQNEKQITKNTRDINDISHQFLKLREKMLCFDGWMRSIKNHTLMKGISSLRTSINDLRMKVLSNENEINDKIAILKEKNLNLTNNMRSKNPSTPSDTLPEGLKLYVSLENLKSGRNYRFKLSDETIYFHVLPGCERGTKIILETKNKIKLVFEIFDEPHPLYKRNGADLIYATEISAFDVFLRTPILIPLLGGGAKKIFLTRPFNSGSEYSIPNEGLPLPNDPNQRGSLKVKLEVKFPDYISNYLMKAIRTE